MEIDISRIGLDGAEVSWSGLSGGLLSIDWGDGHVSQSPNATDGRTQHTYPGVGVYTIKVDNGDGNPETLEIRVEHLGPSVALGNYTDRHVHRCYVLNGPFQGMVLWYSGTKSSFYHARAMGHLELPFI